MSAKSVRFGVIGCGLMGREFASAAARWCHLLGELPRPEIVAVCDPAPGATDWFCQHFRPKTVTADYRVLLEDESVEAVYCAVPHHLHEELYVAILQAGKHLLAEKPYGIDLQAAERIETERAKHPELLVRCSGEFPYFPGAQRIAGMLDADKFGKIIEWRSGFLHSSDLDPMKPINWKRKVAACGEYGCMGDLGLHVVHLPFRFGLKPKNVRALLSKIVEERPDGRGGMAPCETWDNAVLACESEQGFPMIFETKRIAPGETNTWYVQVFGTELSVEFSTKYPKTLRTLPYQQGKTQQWRTEDLGYTSVYPTVTGSIFEFGFTDAMLQMWASFIEELSGGSPAFACARPEEAMLSHRLFTAALTSQKESRVVDV